MHAGTHIKVPLQSEGGVFDIAVRGTAPGDRISIAREAAQRLERVIAEHHGVAFPVYVEYLSNNRSRIANLIRKYTAEFIEIVESNRDCSSPELRIAEKFGLAFAGLRIARRAKVVSFSKREIRESVTTCFSAAMKRQDEALATQQRLKAALKVVLRDEGRIPLLRLGEVPPLHVKGFRRESADGERAYMKADAIGETLGLDEAELREFIRDLRERGHAIRGADGSGTRPVKVGGQQVRYFVFPASFYARPPRKKRRVVAKRRRRPDRVC